MLKQGDCLGHSPHSDQLDRGSYKVPGVRSPGLVYLSGSLGTFAGLYSFINLFFVRSYPDKKTKTAYHDRIPGLASDRFNKSFPVPGCYSWFAIP